ncbi:uncharacterized protein LOC130449008 [Diorhabda sublineata]|uniref:uncharacterized protein LOC130449008 n=1 Tax=Diorhabda sublineata TaxID=1163346 RepID=UPI0024E09C6D|nr:uncharacterized protein LOC130449008 [Diorhabda sublineata]
MRFAKSILQLALQIYLDAASINDPKKRKATLLYFGGLSLQEIFYNLPGANADVPDENGRDIFEIAITKLDEYFSPKQSKVYERHLFRLLKQESGEKYEKFLVRLRHQVVKCQFQAVEEQLIDQITEKCASVDLRKKILAAGEVITLDQIILEANTLETIERQLSGFNEKPSPSSLQTLNAVYTKRKQRTTISRDCSRCGSTEAVHNNCPAINITCHKCKFRGHFAKCCKSTRTFAPSNKLNKGPSRKKFRLGQSDTNNVDNISRTAEAEYVFHLDSDDTVDCEVGGVKVEMLIDSGSLEENNKYEF